MKRSERYKSILKRAAAAMLAAVFAVLTACGGAGTAKVGSMMNEGEPGDYKIPKFRGAKFSEGNAYGNAEAKVDISSVSQGYVGVLVNTEVKTKVQISKGKEEYNFDVIPNKPQIYPLTYGNGKYTIRVLKNIEENTYSELYRCEADVKLKNKYQPYTRPNQYANYSKKSKCVKEARKLAEQSSCEGDFVSKVYEFVCSNVTYDKELAETVKSGYIPDPDEVLTGGKGICFGYACLAASMLRSQGIPTKIIFGYVAPDDLYHAWNMFYTKEQGWVTVEFKTKEKDWSRLDLTFSANGSNDKFIGDGSHYQDVHQF